MRATIALSVLGLALILAPARAQYSPPGSGFELPPDRKEDLEKAIEEAPWHLGPIRVTPWIGVRQLSYQRADGASETGPSEFQGAGGVGVTLLLPAGENVVASGEVLPEVYYSSEDSSQTEVVGRYGLGLFYLANRMELAVTGRRSEEIAILSPEVLRRVSQINTIFDAQTQVRVGGAVAIFLAGSQESWEVDTADVGFATSSLDRDETTLRAGLRYLLRGNHGWVGFGIQDQTTEFPHRPSADHEGSFPYFEIALRGNKLTVAADVAFNELEPTAGASFPGYDEPSGGISLTLEPRPSVRLFAYARADLLYSTTNLEALYESSRQGLGTTLSLGSRTDLQVFAETGDDRYFSRGEADLRIDDVESWGAIASITLRRSLRLELGYRTTDFQSNLPDLDREITELIFGVQMQIRGVGLSIRNRGEN